VNLRPLCATFSIRAFKCVPLLQTHRCDPHGEPLATSRHDAGNQAKVAIGPRGIVAVDAHADRWGRVGREQVSDEHYSTARALLRSNVPEVGNTVAQSTGSAPQTRGEHIDGRHEADGTKKRQWIRSLRICDLRGDGT